MVALLTNPLKSLSHDIQRFLLALSCYLAKRQFFFYALLAVLLWAPLPLGSNRPWSASLLVFLSSSLFLLYVLTRQPVRMPEVPTTILWAFLFYVLSVCWAFVQWSPWTPTAWHHPIWEIGSQNLVQDLAGRITVNPGQTLASALNLCGYLFIFCLAYEIGRSRRYTLRFLNFVVTIFCLYSTYGLAVFFLGNDSLLYFEKWAYHDALTSTFVNRNSFATYIGLGFVCTTALALKQITPILKSGARPRLKVRFAVEYMAGVGRFTLIALLLNGSALMLTSSRAGIASTFAATLLLTFLLTSSRRTSFIKKGVSLSFFALVLMIFMSIASGPLLNRLDDIGLSYAENERANIHSLVARGTLDAPILGTGLGTFPDVFPGYRDTGSFTSKAWVKAHSTYLENALELGLPAALSLNLAVALAGLVCFLQAIRQNRNKIAPSIAAAATVLVGLHATVDFSLQIPAVATTFAALLGVGVGASLTATKQRVRRLR